MSYTVPIITLLGMRRPHCQLGDAFSTLMATLAVSVSTSDLVSQSDLTLATTHLRRGRAGRSHFRLRKCFLIRQKLITLNQLLGVILWSIHAKFWLNSNTKVLSSLKF